MPFAFDAHNFRRLLDDAEEIVSGSRSLERRLVALVESFDGEREFADDRYATFGESGGRASSAAGSQSPSFDALGRLRAICVDAREHRERAETLLRHLVGGSQTRDRVSNAPRVLVVDDSRDTLDLMSFALESAGYEAITANNGLEGVIVAHYARPAVVLMDVTMPVLNGIDAARLLKSSPATRHLDVIACTANSEAGELANLFVHVVKKPAPVDDILAAVRRFSAAHPSDGDGAAGLRDT
jgi:CheY-like chemotaxis protein